MFIKKVLMIVLVSVIYVINLNIPVAAEENEQDIIFSPNLNWKVGIKTEKKTKAFHKNAGSKITVNVSVLQKKKAYIGIAAKNIGKIYVDTRDKVNKTFNIKKTGEYSVFVTNKSDSTIQVVGNYTK